MPNYPGGAPVPFVPGLYQPNTTIADLILRAGQQRAEGQRQIWEGLANTLARLGQIPAEIQHSRALEARTAREQALAEEERARAAEMAHQVKQRDLAAHALGGGGEAGFVGPPSAQQQAAQGGHQNPTGASVLDPEVITQRLQAAGADPEYISKAVASAKSIMESKKAYRSSFSDMIGSHALEIIPSLGTKFEAGAVQTALSSLQEEGVPQEKLAQIASAYQADPKSFKDSVLMPAILGSKEASAEYAKTYGSLKEISPGGQLVAGAGLPGGGQVVATGTPKPETRSIDDQLADAAPGGQRPNPARFQELLGIKRQAALASHVTDPSQKLVKVEHKDPTTGKTVIEWLPQSEVRGKTFEKGVGSTLEARLASAEAVNQTGNDIIKQLQDPNVASVVGPAMGRLGKVRDWIGNPPPELSNLAGLIESYALANMGVHGMRSVQGSEKINKLLDAHHTPESLIAAIKGLQGFSSHFMENEGRPAGGGPRPTVSFNPKTGQLE